MAAARVPPRTPMPQIEEARGNGLNGLCLAPKSDALQSEHGWLGMKFGPYQIPAESSPQNSIGTSYQPVLVHELVPRYWVAPSQPGY